MGYFDSFEDYKGDWDEVYVKEYKCNHCGLTWDDSGNFNRYEPECSQIELYWPEDLIVLPNECPWCKSNDIITY